jgi:dolichol-phosphate mannosyltransferase
MSESRLLCSVIIPTYNEAENIVPLLTQIHELFFSLPDIDCEIYVIDDNSSDSTAALVKQSPHTYLVQRPAKLGIGSAYRDAFGRTKGEIIAIMDADFSHNPKDLRRLLEIHGGAQGCVVFSSRYISGGRIENWNFFRRLISFTANGFARFILRIPFTDVTSAFRVYSRDVFEEIVHRSVAPGFAFQVEAAFWSKSLAARTAEVPVVFRDRRKGHSKFNVREILSFVVILIRCVLVLVSRRW